LRLGFFNLDCSRRCDRNWVEKEKKESQYASTLAGIREPRVLSVRALPVGAVAFDEYMIPTYGRGGVTAVRNPPGLFKIHLHIINTVPPSMRRQERHDAEHG
jgi:hypothetical protein